MAYKAQSPGKSAQHDEAGCHLCVHQPRRPLAFVPDPGYSDRYVEEPGIGDQPMGQGAGSVVCQRTVGEYPVPNYGSVDSVNHALGVMRTRMRVEDPAAGGGVGRGSSKLRFTRLTALMSLFSNDSELVQNQSGHVRQHIQADVLG
jgi:hypothetical protein